MLTRESVSIITVGKYNRISTPRVLMLENSPCDVDSGFHPCWNKDVDDDDADHADVVDIDSQTDSQVDTPCRDGKRQLRGVSDRTSQPSDRAGAVWA